MRGTVVRACQGACLHTYDVALSKHRIFWRRAAASFRGSIYLHVLTAMLLDQRSTFDASHSNEQERCLEDFASCTVCPLTPKATCSRIPRLTKAGLAVLQLEQWMAMLHINRS